MTIKKKTVNNTNIYFLFFIKFPQMQTPEKYLIIRSRKDKKKITCLTKKSVPLKMTDC